jgi:hypothetical protein
MGYPLRTLLMVLAVTGLAIIGVVHVGYFVADFVRRRCGRFTPPAFAVT